MALTLPVLQNEVLPRNRTVEPIRLGDEGGPFHSLDRPIPVEYFRGDPPKLYFLPHVRAGRTVAHIAVPCTGSHEVPHAGAGKFTSA